MPLRFKTAGRGASIQYPVQHPRDSEPAQPNRNQGNPRTKPDHAEHTRTMGTRTSGTGNRITCYNEPHHQVETYNKNIAKRVRPASGLTNKSSGKKDRIRLMTWYFFKTWHRFTTTRISSQTTLDPWQHDTQAIAKRCQGHHNDHPKVIRSS